MKASIRSAAAAALHILILTLLSSGARAQTSNTDGTTPAGLSPGAPAGSYSLTGFENVNLYNGNLNVSLPLLSVGGRGGAGYTVTLSIEQKWRIEQFAEPFPGQPPVLTPVGNWWGELKPGYGPGVMEGRRGGYGDWYEQTYCGSAADASRVYMDMLTRLTFTAADGTEYELRDLQTGGQPINLTNVPCGSNGNSRGRVFVTADGSAATFVSDTAINDYKWKPMGVNDQFRPSGYLWLRDGTRYRIDNGLVSWLQDRNGNRMTFSYSNNRITTATDSLNRQVTFSYAGGGIAYDQISFNGFGGQPRSLKIWKASMGSVLRSGYALQTYAQLFPDMTGASSFTQFNPSKVSAVELPNGRTYQFRYNSYGELARIELPTGGAMEYDWIDADTLLVDSVIYRRVSERRLYKDGTNLENKITYSNPGLGQGVEVKTYNSLGTLLAYSKHYHCGSALESMSSEYATPISYPLNLAEGREVQTDVFSTNGATVLRRVQNTWNANGTLGGRPINPRLVETVQTIEPSGANLVSKQTFAHDQYNNQTDVYEYGFRSGGVDPLVRRTHTDYFTSSYDTLNPSSANPDPSLTSHIRNLPRKVFIYDAAGIVRARVETEYDNYTLDGSDCLHSFHCPLTARLNISGLDAQFTTTYTKRGNPTAVTRYLLSNGTVTGSISSYSQYDVAGNVVRVLDPRSTLANNIATTLEYDDRFGIPGDNEARSNSAPVQLAGLNSFAFPTKVINALGHTSYAQFDYYLGKPVNGEDANGVVANGYFNDSLDRPTQIRRAVGTGDQNQTTFAYDDISREITTSSDRDTYGDKILVSKVLYDKLGRTSESRQYEGGSNYIVVETQYDALGRAFKTSNPYRWQEETAVWTTQAFDALGRVISVTTPDNAVVTTSYSGNSVTVIDQAGKARKSVTDALGRLVEVYEDPISVNPSGRDYQTSYLYDVLDNLVKVTQGGQQRFFMYDSLKRLVRSRNPEQGTFASLNLTDPFTGNSSWSVGYQYDVNGNLTQRTDARGVVSTYTYDALNRSTTIDYSDTSSINPDVTRYYDGAINGKGHFWYNYAGGDFANGSNVENTAVDSYDALGRPTVQRQLFKVNGGWGPTYQTSRTYNRAGAVTAQTYPSGHTATYLYDAAGRTSSFSGNLGNDATRTYASAVIYDAFGSVRQEQFGTQTPLYHKKHYNKRGQLFSVRLSTVPRATDQWNWNRGAIVNYYSSNYAWEGDPATPASPDNNGNVLRQQHWIPGDDAISSYSYTQDTYTYDALNRIQSAVEVHGTPAGQSAQDYAQVFAYDRWGNRRIDPASWGVGINTKQFTVDAATNRLGVPAGQPGVMSYDNAGNLITDTYTGVGSRTYDAENRMLTAADNTGQTSRYGYNADGQRVRRQVASSQQEWQIYGMDGELLAEYRGGASTTAPDKEYGYRNGELLITADGAPAQTIGSTPNAATFVSQQVPQTMLAQHHYAVSVTFRNTGSNTWTTANHYNLGVANDNGVWGLYRVALPSSVAPNQEVTFNFTITAPSVPGNYSFQWRVVQDYVEWFGDYSTNVSVPVSGAGGNGGNAAECTWQNVPSTMTAGQSYTLTVKMLNTGSNTWTTANYYNLGSANDNGAWGLYRVGLPSSVAPNQEATFTFTVTAPTTPGTYNFQWRMVQDYVEWFGDSSTNVAVVVAAPLSSTIHWLVMDHLGTPRMVVDQTGSLANVKRHDYLPFGEELFAPAGARNTAQGYASGDGVRQQFTTKERDVETGLDYLGARYYSNTQGRFTSPDELDGLSLIVGGTATKVAPKVSPLPYADLWNPQSINKYHYTLNNPLKFIDPDGHGYRRVEEKDKDGKQIVRYEWVNDEKVHDVPNNHVYVDTQGRVIQLFGDDKSNYHSWGVVEPDKKVQSDQEGNGPASFRDWGDTRQALLNAGYKPFYSALHPGGFDFGKESSPTLHITVYLEDCCKGNFGKPWGSDRIQGTESHMDRISPVTHPVKHILLETLPNIAKPLRPTIDPRGPFRFP